MVILPLLGITPYTVVYWLILIDPDQTDLEKPAQHQTSNITVGIVTMINSVEVVSRKSSLTFIILSLNRSNLSACTHMKYVRLTRLMHINTQQNIFLTM